MGNHNSLVSLTEMCVNVFHAGQLDTASASEIVKYPERELKRDNAVMRNRAKHEGIAFFTKTLPSLAKAIDKALATNTPLQCTGFQLESGTQIPLFLGTLVKQVFDASGCERSDASVWALKCLRQLLLTYYKLELPPNKVLEQKVIQEFVNTDATLEYNPEQLSTRDQFVRRMARSLIARVLGTVDPFSDLKPRHGPGSVATGEQGHRKMWFSRYYKGLALGFPYEDYFYMNLNHLTDKLDQFRNLTELRDGTAKVVLVPKDSRGPRLISMEPLEFQWIQQGLMRKMVSHLEAHPLTGGRVNFTNQKVNRDLAMAGSRGDPWVTLDMKEASDRVSLALVRDLFPEPWVKALECARSSFTELPCGAVVHLRKFAPMGSAVCFPVEALIFWALCVGGTYYARQGQGGLLKACHSCFVYGDDLVVGSDVRVTVEQLMPSFGLLLNKNKCCVGDSFRESCGCDAFRGVDVTPLKQRATWTDSLAGTIHASMTEYANAYYERGWFNSGDYIVGLIQRVRTTPYADRPGAPYISIVDPRKVAAHENRRLGFRYRVHPEYQRLELKCWAVRSRTEEVPGTSGWDELLRKATAQGWSIPDHSGSSFCRSLLNRGTLRGYAIQMANTLAEPVLAYQYALPRQASLRRGWYPV